MRRNLFYLLILFLLSGQTGISQTVKIEKKDELSPELRKDAAAFVREAFAEVGTLRTPENRVGFSSEMASLMWFTDEREARAMYQTVFNDFRQLIAQYDSQLNQTGDDENENLGGGGFMFFGGGGSSSTRKMTKALAVRQQIAASLAEHDAELALDFFTTSGQAVTNPKFRKQIEERDAYFETRLLAQIAEQDPDTALKYGRKNLAKAFNFQLIGVLKKIYEKDRGKGAAFGEEIVQKLKSAPSKSGNFYELGSLLNLGAKNFEQVKGKSGEKPMFSEQSMRDIADLLAKELLKGGEGYAEEGYAENYIPQIEKFSPARAIQLRQKFSQTKQIAGPVRGSTMAMMPPPPPMPMASPAPMKTDGGADNQKQLTESMQSLGGKQLSKEEREKTVAQARKTINALKDPTQKLMALSALALQISALGDKESALSIMDEAKNSVNSQPKNYVDFLQNWMLAGSYAQIDAKKAFPILEESILRLNDTLGAVLKVGEFIDVGGEMIEDGEAQVGAFGGEMTRGLLGNLGAADQTVRRLAQADFARTKELTNKFDRVEARILAKMIVLRAVLGKKEIKEIEILGADMMEP